MMSRIVSPPRLTVVLAALVVCLSCSTSAVTPRPDDEATIHTGIHSAFRELVAAARDLDTERYLAIIDHQRFTALNADGTVTHTFESFAEQAREQFSSLQAYESLDFHNVEITVVDATTAVLVNEYRAVVRLASGEAVSAAGAGAQVWSSTQDGWRLVHISSSLRPAATDT